MVIPKNVTYQYYFQIRLEVAVVNSKLILVFLKIVIYNQLIILLCGSLIKKSTFQV